MSDNEEALVFLNALKSIRELDARLMDLYRASNLMHVLGYTEWDQCTTVIERAMNNFGDIVTNLFKDNGFKMPKSYLLTNTNNNFIAITRTVYTVEDGTKELPDYILTKLACYAVIMEADNDKPMVRLAKRYFFASFMPNEKERDKYISNLQKVAGKVF